MLFLSITKPVALLEFVVIRGSLNQCLHVKRTCQKDVKWRTS